MADGGRTSLESKPPQKIIIPGAQSPHEKTVSLDVDRMGEIQYARESLPAFYSELKELGIPYYVELVKAADNLPAKKRWVLPGQKPGHLEVEWEDEVQAKGDGYGRSGLIIAKTNLYFDRTSALLDAPDLKYHETKLWQKEEIGNKHPQGIINLALNMGEIQAIRIKAPGISWGRISEIAAINEGQDPEILFYNAEDTNFGGFLKKHFSDSALDLEINFANPSIVLNQIGRHGQKYSSFFSIDKDETSMPVFRGNLTTAEQQKRLVMGGATKDETLTPAQFKAIAEAALKVLPQKAA